MEYIYIGKLVNTHGIKGEVRILSNFDFKEKIFKKNNALYLGEEKEKKVINSYRKHKNFDMVIFDNINDIQDVLKYKGMKVYFKKTDLSLDENEILDEDLIGVSVYFKDKKIGVIDSIENYGNKLFKINGKLIPYNDNFIESISKDKLVLKNVEELI